MTERVGRQKRNETDDISSTTRNPDMPNFHYLWKIKFKGSHSC